VASDKSCRLCHGGGQLRPESVCPGRHEWIVVGNWLRNLGGIEYDVELRFLAHGRGERNQPRVAVNYQLCAAVSHHWVPPAHTARPSDHLAPNGSSDLP